MKRLKFFGLPLVIFFILLSLITFITNRFSDDFHSNIKSNPKKYCYHKDFKYYLFVIDDLSQAEQYISYFEKHENGLNVENSGFRNNTIPNGSEVYVLGYESDSLLVHIACYYKKGGFTKLFKGFTFHSTIHDDTLNLGRN